AISVQLSDLLLHWQELRRQGQTPQAEQLCAGHPEILEEFVRRVRAIESMEAMLGLAHVPAPEQTTAVSPLDMGGEQRDAQSGPSFASLPQIPGYELLSLLGQGGMGIVYKARQVSLKRLIALKMISAGADARPDQLARFRTEAEAAAELRHPNIVQIYEIGEFQGRPFFSMELVEGGSLAQKLAGAVLPAHHAAQLLEVLAEAVAAAHGRGIIHRDLKPANVLLQTAEVGSQSEKQFQCPPFPIEDRSAAIPKIT